MQHAGVHVRSNEHACGGLWSRGAQAVTCVGSVVVWLPGGNGSVLPPALFDTSPEPGVGPARFALLHIALLRTSYGTR